MNKKFIHILLVAFLVTSAFSVTASAQGRGRGLGLGRKSDVFVNGHDARNGRWDGRGPNQNWKCGVFVNCHDARNGRLDGRGPRFSSNRNGIFVPRSVRVRNRVRNSDLDAIRQARLNRLEMLRQERISEQRYFRNRGWSRRP